MMKGNDCERTSSAPSMPSISDIDMPDLWAMLNDINPEVRAEGKWLLVREIQHSIDAIMRKKVRHLRKAHAAQKQSASQIP